MEQREYYGEIVGLRKSGNGRSCACHEVCGTTLKLDDLIKFKKVVVTVEDKVLNAVCVKVIRDGTETCTVGFIPQVEVATRGDLLHNKYGQVVEFYHDLHEEDVVRRERDHRFCGVASYILLDGIINEDD